MANKYCNLDGYRKIKDTFGEINTGFDGVEDDLGALDDRVDTIITTPIDGEAAAQELVDARKGEATLGAKIDAMDNALGSHLEEDAKDAHQGINRTGDNITGIYAYNTYWYNNVMTIMSSKPSAESGLKIKTNITTGSRNVLYIKYYRYISGPLGATFAYLILSFRYFNNEIYSRKICDLTNTNPETKIALEDGKVVIHLDVDTSNDHVIHIDVMSTNDVATEQITGWGIAHEEISESATVVKTFSY